MCRLGVFSSWYRMKTVVVLLLFLLGISFSASGLQARTPQAALEEIATADKPEVLARHLPEPLQSSIEVLPPPQKQQVLDKLLSLKAEQFSGCAVRRTSNGDAWEITDARGVSKGKVKLANVFISGLDALLSLTLEADSSSQRFIVAMRLEGDDWRIDDFGSWDHTELGLGKLVHQLTELEKNEAAAEETLSAIRTALNNYAQQFPQSGYPAQLQMLLGAGDKKEASEEHAGLLDASFAPEPLIKDGYEFRYSLTRRSEVRYIGPLAIGDRGDFQLIATPIDFGRTGSKRYLVTSSEFHVTTENREATEDDPTPDDPD
jgi:hypothetical protein